MINISDLEKTLEIGQHLEVGGVVLDIETISVLLLIYYTLTAPHLKEKFVRMLNNETERLVEFCWNQLI